MAFDIPGANLEGGEAGDTSTPAPGWILEVPMSNNSRSEQPVITVSESAADMIKSAARNANAEDAVVRFSIQQTESTIAHRIDLEPEAESNDLVFEQYGITMVVDREQVPLLAGSHFDYTEEGSTGKLLVSNPNLPRG